MTRKQGRAAPSDPDSVREKARSIGDMNDRNFFCLASMRSRDFLEPGDVADRLMWDALEKAFGKEIRRLEKAGDDGALEIYVGAVIAGLEETDGILAEYSPDTADTMVYLLREYLGKGNVSKLFRDVKQM